MKDWFESLGVLKPSDLARLLCRGGEAARLLEPLARFPFGEGSLLDFTQAVMEELAANPPLPLPPRSEGVLQPWWSPMPAALLAALFQHAALPSVSSPEAGRARLMPPHARDSGLVAREALRAAGVPFAVREHAVLLIQSRDRPAGLLGSGAPAESYMKLSCALDLAALYHLRLAELRALGRREADEPVRRLETFRRRAQELGVWGRPSPPRLTPKEAAELGYGTPRETHRALNAARYFELVAHMQEGEWYRERLREERDRPRGRLHLMVGPAGCGKSTWAQAHLADAVHVSSDEMRRELTGDPGDQSQNYLVFQRCMDRIRQRLQEGEEVVFDATNYSEVLRSMPVQAARWSAAEITSYTFDVPLADALTRNLSRPRRVPEAVIRRHCRLLEPPALYEADRHVAVGADGESTVYWPVGDAAGDARRER